MKESIYFKVEDELQNAVKSLNEIRYVDYSEDEDWKQRFYKAQGMLEGLLEEMIFTFNIEQEETK